MSNNPHNPYTEWSDDQLRLESLKYNSRGVFSKENPAAYSTAYRRGILDDVCSHMPPKLTYWTEETLQTEALKYTSRSEFQKGSNGAYSTAHKRGIINDVCSHMSYKRTYWTEETIQTEALKYTSRSEFQKAPNGAYMYAYKRGIIDEVCSHMPKTLRGIHCYSQDRPGTVYFVEIQDGTQELLKVGITLKDVKNRFSTDIKNGIMINVIRTIDFNSSIDAFLFEQSLLNCSIDHQLYDRDNKENGPLIAGNTELRDIKAFDIINNNMDNMDNLIPILIKS